MNKKLIRPLYLLAGMFLLSSFVAGCSSGLRYSNDSFKNFEVKRKIKSGSFFTRIQIAAKIYDLEGKCKTKYKGYIVFNEEKTLIGLSLNKPSYIVFNFYSGNIADRRPTGIIRESVIITPRKGDRYRADVQYIDDAYYTAVFKKRKGSKQWKQIKLKGLGRGCP